MMNTLANQNIICFGPTDWWHMNPSSGTHIMRRLAMTNRVLYVNPVSSDLLGMRSRRGVAARVFRKLKSMVRLVKRVDSHLHVMSPIFIPIQGHPVVDRINNALLKIQLGAAMLLLRFARPLLWVENIRAADCLGWFNWRLVIYHASDKFDECSNTRNKAALYRRENLITEFSDIVICASRKLYDLKRTVRPDVHYLPHGVDAELFSRAAEAPEPLDGLEIAGPVAGYFGTLTDQNDIELLEYCAASLRNVQFVFAGRVTGGDYDKLGGLPNVYFLGQVPYEKIPHLCARFDVCLLPWRMSAWIEHCNPLKLFEYMASGKPIVSVPICEVQDHYSEIVTVARTKEQFCRAIEEELTGDTEERKQMRMETANRHAWERHIRRLSSIINNALADSQRNNLEPEVILA